MAAMIESAGKSGTANRAPRMTPRIDLTAMVDLAFLLITFFMLTTSLSKPCIMPIIMPETETDEPVPTKNSQVLTLLLGKDKVYYYEGLTDARLDSTDFSAKGLRSIILDKQARVDAEFGRMEREDPKHPGEVKSYSKLNILIKSTREARYKNLVDTFDEMKICGVATYMLLDISPQEEAFIRYPAAGLQQ